MRSAVTQSVQVLDRRLNALGTTEPSIQAEGSDRILVQVPGLQDTTQLKQILGQTARMTFHMECTEATSRRRCNRAAAGLRAGRNRPTARSRPILVEIARAPDRRRPRRCAAGLRSADRPSRSSPSASTRAARTIFGEVTQAECRAPLRRRARRQIHHRPGDPRRRSSAAPARSKAISPSRARRTSPCCCAPARCRPTSPSSRSAPSARASGRIPSAPAPSPSIVALVAVVVFMVVCYGILGLFADHRDDREHAS